MAEHESNSNTKKISAYPFEVTVEQLAAIAEQRRREKETDLQRQAMYIGSLFVAVMGEPGPGGNYGLYTPEHIATQLRSWVAMGADFLAELGHPLQMGTPAFAPLLELLARGMSPSEAMSTGASTASRSSERKAPSEQETTTTQDFIPDGKALDTLGLDDSTIL